ncbi:MAG: hypothetical protein RJB66_626 [Pseudomonadota bacterium]|jgi:drug/metabolite transporter (DMT)-like permease
MTKKRAIIELILADLFWGFSFVAIPMAQELWTSSQITFLRFAGSSIVGVIYFILLQAERPTRKELFLGLGPGLMFVLTIFFQTLGLEYTTPSKSSFITVLYVLIVPMIESKVLKRPLGTSFWMFLLGSLVGLSLLLKLQFNDWNWGDSITLICALSASWHIHQVGHLSKIFTNPIKFNFIQCFWAAVFISPLSLSETKSWIPASPKIAGIFSLLMIIFGATIVAFAIQVRAQRTLSLSTSATLFLLESPFAMIFSWLVLKEQITLVQITGAAVIFICCYGAIRTVGDKVALQDLPK